MFSKNNTASRHVQLTLKLSPETSTKLLCKFTIWWPWQIFYISSGSELKKTRTFEEARRFIDIHTAGYMSAYHIRPHAVLGDVSTVFKLPFSFPFYFSRTKRALKMSTFLWCSAKRGGCITFHHQPSNGKMVTDNNQNKATKIKAFGRNLHAF